MIEELILKNRSIRRFSPDELISTETLRWLVGLARLSPSGANLQPLKYILSNDKTKNEKIFECLSWAGYLNNWNGPLETERPTAYIIILNDNDISKDPGCDHGIAAQSMMLGAAEKGIAGCMIGSIDRNKLRSSLMISNQYDIRLVLAFGKANEKVIIEPVKEDGNIKYYRDENNIHHVPKRKLSELILDL
jgi:nitroreductase